MLRKTIMYCVLGALFGCQSDLSVKEYLEWSKSYPISEVQSVGEISISCTFKPSELMALNDLRDDIFLLDKDSIYTVIEQYDSSSFIVLTFDTKDQKTPILKHGIARQQEYHDRIFYFNTSVGNDILVMNGPDTLKLVNQIFERAYSLRSYENLLLAFDGKVNRNYPLKVKYSGLFTESPITFEFTTSTLNKIPNLKI